MAPPSQELEPPAIPGRFITAMTLANATAIRRALENAGVELIEENGGEAWELV